MMLLRCFAALLALTVLHTGGEINTVQPGTAQEMPAEESAESELLALGRTDFSETGAEGYITLAPPESWQYDETVSEMHPGIATFYNGDNVLSFSGYATEQNGQETLQFLKNALDDETEGTEQLDGGWYRIAGEETLQRGKTCYYVHISQQGGVCKVIWAKLYCAFDGSTAPEPGDMDEIFLEFIGNCTVEE